MIMAELDAVLKPGGRLIQFTYDLSPVAGISPRFERVATKIVWRNIPPARVNVFMHRDRSSLRVQPALRG